MLRVIGTAKNQAVMAELIAGLKGSPAKEAEVNEQARHSQLPEDVPQGLGVNYTLLAEDMVKTRQFASRAPKPLGAASSGGGLFLFYWAAGVGMWVLFDKYGLGHATDLGAVLATVVALFIACGLATLHVKSRSKSLLTAPEMSTVPDSSVYLTPEAVICNYPSHSLALCWKHAKHLIVEDSGIAIFHSSFVVFVPPRAFVDAAHRAKFVNGIISLAPHLNAQVSFAKSDQLTALEPTDFPPGDVQAA